MKKIIGYYSDTDSLGGSEIYLRTLLENIDNTRYQVKFFCRSFHPLAQWAQQRGDIQLVFLDGCLRNENSSGGVMARSPMGPRNDKNSYLNAKILFFKLCPTSVKLFFGTIKTILRLKKIFQQEHLDLIHFNDTGCEPPVIAARLAGIKPIVGTYHVIPAYDKAKCGWVERLTEYFSVRSLDLGIAVSKATKDMWVERTNLEENKITVIYNGIDLAKFDQPVDRARIKGSLDIPLDAPVVGCCARLHPMKGHQYLIEAAADVKKKIPGVKFFCVGEGPLRDELTRQVDALGLKDTILFLGHRDDVIDITKIFDIAVLPSVSLESLSYVLIEAMACSKATVASHFSGIVEVVQDGISGILVPRFDARALANAISELLSNKEKALAMGLNGRKRVEELFTQKRMLSETFQIYDTLLTKAKHNYKVAVVSAKLEHIKRGVETWARDTAYCLAAKGVDVTLYKGSGASHFLFEKALPSIKEGSDLSKRLV